MSAMVCLSRAGPRCPFCTPGTISGWSSAYWKTSLSSPGVSGPAPVKPEGKWSLAGPSGSWTCCRLRGRPNSTVAPVATSTLATVMLSVRTPGLLGAESPPSSRKFTRSAPFHGSWAMTGVVAVVPRGNRVFTTSRDRYASRVAYAVGASTSAQRATVSVVVRKRPTVSERAGRTRRNDQTITPVQASATATSATVSQVSQRGCTASDSRFALNAVNTISTPASISTYAAIRARPVLRRSAARWATPHSRVEASVSAMLAPGPNRRSSPVMPGHTPNVRPSPAP